MSDSYMAISEIAKDDNMTQRMYAAVTQQQSLGSIHINLTSSTAPFNAQEWVDRYRYVWAASPGWGAAWESAEAGGNQDPGKDPAVITDQMILSTVQELFGVTATEG